MSDTISTISVWAAWAIRAVPFGTGRARRALHLGQINARWSFCVGAVSHTTGSSGARIGRSGLSAILRALGRSWQSVRYQEPFGVRTAGDQVAEDQRSPMRRSKRTPAVKRAADPVDWTGVRRQ